MKDGPFRRAIKAVARWKYAADLAVTRRLRPAPFALGGDCRRCARCCEAPAIRAGWIAWIFPSLFLAWHRHVNGFHLVSRDDAARTFAFRCAHFDPQACACDSYDSRPGMCRDYPRGLLHRSAPDFFPECGFRPVARNAGALRASLEKRGLSPEQLAELKKKLYLE